MTEEKPEAEKFFDGLEERRKFKHERVPFSITGTSVADAIKELEAAIDLESANGKQFASAYVPTAPTPTRKNTLVPYRLMTPYDVTVKKPNSIISTDTTA